MSKNAELFSVSNENWSINEVESGVFELVSADKTKKMTKLSAKQLASALAVISELARHLESGR